MNLNPHPFRELPYFSDLPRRSASVVAAAHRAIREHQHLLIIAAPSIVPTMIARRMPSHLRGLNDLEKGAVRRNYQRARLLPDDAGNDAISRRPFRAPHHTVSTGALEQEAELAMYGVLLLDCLPEFRLRAIAHLGECFRKTRWDKRPLVVASAMPCPCGYHGTTGKHARRCSCSQAGRESYSDRVRHYCHHLGIDIKTTAPQLALADFRQSV